MYPNNLRQHDRTCRLLTYSLSSQEFRLPFGQRFEFSQLWFEKYHGKEGKCLNSFAIQYFGRHNKFIEILQHGSCLGGRCLNFLDSRLKTQFFTDLDCSLKKNTSNDNQVSYCDTSFSSLTSHCLKYLHGDAEVLKIRHIVNNYSLKSR